MKKITLIDKFVELQNQYVKKLETILHNFNSQNLSFLIDEINVFWYSKKNLVELILDEMEYDSSDKYLLTGITSIDIETKELYPYITMGNIHIIDDAFSNLGSILSNIPNQDFEENLKEKVLKIAKENIKIIKEYGDYICILPLTTYATNTEFETIKKGANNVFFSLFKNNINSIEEYNEFNNIVEVFNNLTDIAKSVIIFSDNDSVGNILDRFNNFKNRTITPFTTSVDDIFLFYSIIHSFLMRALSIMLICNKYNFIPYLRYKLIFHYFLILSESFIDKIDIMSNMRTKAICSFLISHIFNREMVKNVTLNNFHQKVKETDFYNRLNKDIENVQPSTKNSFEYLEKILNKHLKSLYSKLNCFIV